ncbi:hypothetical protein TNCV_223401 [Trichonephila clavipes]|nr:hypothetical protein TNCV_223401 [Trichonephila clavipes]
MALRQTRSVQDDPRGVIDRTRNPISISGSVRRQGRKAVNKLSSASHFPSLVGRSRCSEPHVKDGGQNGGGNSPILVRFGTSLCLVAGDVFNQTTNPDFIKDPSRKVDFAREICGIQSSHECRLDDVVDGLLLAFCTQGCGLNPGPSRWIFMMQKIDSRMIIRHVKDP